MGRVPRKRHVQFRDPDHAGQNGNAPLLVEEVLGFEGFSGNESILYHLFSPCRVKEVGAFERIGAFWRSHAASAPPLLAPSAGRVDVDDRGIDALDDVCKAEGRRVYTRGRRPGAIASRRRGCRCRSAGRDRRARGAAGDDRADEKSDNSGERNGDERETPRHGMSNCSL